MHAAFSYSCKRGDSMSEDRKKFITENTKINIDEEMLKIKAQELFWESLVEYANEKYKSPVLELKK
jgi:hypothetical protein